MTSLLLFRPLLYSEEKEKYAVIMPGVRQMESDIDTKQ